MSKILLITTLCFFSCTVFSGKYLRSEQSYIEQHCKGSVGYTLADRTQVDCLTPVYAIEFERGHKWKESIGQSLHYSVMTGKKAAVVLIIKSPQSKYLRQLKTVIDKKGLDIAVFTVPE